MIALFTDFGSQDSYVGQLHAVFAQQAPGIPVIDLFHHVPKYDIRAGAYLLSSLISVFPADTIFVCVVDPGVGSKRRPLYLQADGFRFVGPDNGLFEIIKRRARQCDCFTIDWRPENLSNSFHGRDLFVPVAAMLARGEVRETTPTLLYSANDMQWPDDLAEVIHIDHFGNAITGYRASSLAQNAIISINQKVLEPANTYSDVASGTAFWYENANGLVEIAVNQGSAARQLAITPGMPITVKY